MRFAKRVDLKCSHTCIHISPTMWGAAAAAAKLLQSCPTLCDPIDGSPPGSPVPGILQARTLEWVAISLGVLINLIVAITLQCICLSNLHMIHLKYNFICQLCFNKFGKKIASITFTLLHIFYFCTSIWEGLGAGGEGDDRGWDGWMASLTRWTWTWVNSGSWWWTGRPGVLRFIGSWRVGHDWAAELNWRTLFAKFFVSIWRMLNPILNKSED